MAAYYAAIAVYAIGPERLWAWARPRLRSGATWAGGAAAKTAGGLAALAKLVRWDPESLLEVHPL